MSAEVETMFSVREMPWHRRGVVLDDPPTGREAIVAAGLDWKVAKRPMIWLDQDGQPHKAGDKIAITRKYPDDNVSSDMLGVATERYAELQNEDAFSFFDPVVDDGFARYETAGSLRDGRNIWILAAVEGGMDIGGDEVKDYLLLSNSHDGSSSVVVQPTSIRVVCNNTLMASLSTGNKYHIRHCGDIRGKLNEAAEIMGFTREYFNRTHQVFKKFHECELTKTRQKWYIDRFIGPLPEDAGERAVNNREWRRKSVESMIENGRSTALDDYNPRTLWATYNGAIEHIEWNEGSRTSDLGNYQLFGAGAQQRRRAFELAEEELGAA